LTPQAASCNAPTALVSVTLVSICCWGTQRDRPAGQVSRVPRTL